MYFLQVLLRACPTPQSFDVEPGEFKRILNNQRGHWLMVSTICRPHPAVSLYNSFYRSAVTRLKSQIASLLHTQQSTIELNLMDCQVQSGGCDCRLFAIANTTALVLGDDPNKLFFDHAGKNETTPVPVPGKGIFATFPHKEKQTSYEESGVCGLL